MNLAIPPGTKINIDKFARDPARISFTRTRDAIRGRISDPGSFSPSRA